MLSATRRIKLARSRKRASTFVLKRQIELAWRPQSPDAKILKLCAEYLKAQLRYERNPDDESEYGCVEWINDQQWHFARQLSRMPARTFDGLRAKIMLLMLEGDPEYWQNNWGSGFTFDELLTSSIVSDAMGPFLPRGGRHAQR